MNSWSAGPLTDTVFELVFPRPGGLVFAPGQHLTLCSGDGKFQRDYTPVSAPDDPNLVFCIRRLGEGGFSAVLSKAGPGRRFFLRGPRGHFVFHPSSRPAVFAATGTGIAPFVAMVAVGIRPHLVLHGVKNACDLFYAHVFKKKGIFFVPCLSDEIRPPAGCFFRPGDPMDPHPPFAKKI